MGALTLTQVTKSFGTTQVIKGVDLAVEDGAFCVFVGPSGCGKSTLLRMIAGLEDVTSGDVAIDGARVNDLAPARREIAMVFQSYALYPHLTVRDNMGLALKQAGTPRAQIEAATGKAAEMLALAHLLERRPAELSGGQRQRVAIGRAIVRRPKLFLFDEPLSNLDAALRVQTRIEIARLHRELGATMIYVTHDQVEAMTLADKIVVMREGRVEQAGAPLDLYDNPDNLFVAGFIGSPKMNFLKAVVAGANLTLPELDQILPMPPLSTRLADGTEVTLGLRPDIFKRGGSASLNLTIEIVEQLGGETFAYARQGVSTQVLTIAVEDGRALRPGQALTASFDPTRALLFDALGQRLR